MENTSKKNLEYQYDVIYKEVVNHLTQANCAEDLDCDDLIEQLKGIKEIQVALITLTN